MPDKQATDLSAADEQRATFNEVLWRELQALRPEYCASRQFQPAKFDAQQPDAAGTDPQFQDNLRELYQMIGTLDADADSSKAQPPLSALCLSGGGIRSATFNLGVLQALAKNNMLGDFDYLSSVSGGGYIASWLQAWIHRQQQDEGTSRQVFDNWAGAATSRSIRSRRNPALSITCASSVTTSHRSSACSRATPGPPPPSSFATCC